jgi:hypothetical protein
MADPTLDQAAVIGALMGQPSVGQQLQAQQQQMNQMNQPMASQNAPSGGLNAYQQQMNQLNQPMTSDQWNQTLQQLGPPVYAPGG